MKLLYITNARIPTEKAHGVQIMHMCAAFARRGFDVQLVVPRRHNHIRTEAFSYYNLPQTFEIMHLACWDTQPLRPILRHFAFWLQSIFFALAARNFVKRYRKVYGDDFLIYSRDIFTLYALRHVVPPEKIIFEAHNFPQRILRWHKTLFSGLKKIVVISQALADDFGSAFSNLKILVARDGFDAERFASAPDQKKSREILGIPEHIPVVAYTGQLFAWKGVETLIKAKQWLPDAWLYIVGGARNDVRNLKSFAEMLELKNIIFTGQKPPQDVPLYLAAADVVVIPNSEKEMISRRYTSPLKVFEAMAMGKAMVVSDLPSLREILSEETAYFFQADSPQSLSKAVNFLLNNPELRILLGKAAKKESFRYSWDARAVIIEDFILE